MKHIRLISLTTLALSATFATAQPVFVGPPIRIDVGRGDAAANETSIAASRWGRDVAGSWNDWSEGTFNNEIIRAGVGLSSNFGNTWTDFTLRPPSANRSSVEGDPYTIYDERTGNVWVGAISFAGNGGVYIARKNPGANTFQPSVMVRAASGTDKIWGTAGPEPGNPNSTALYVAYNFGVQRSNDLGATWSNPVSLGSGLGFNPRVGPEGNVYVAYWDFNDNRLKLRRSTNGGSTFGSPVNLATRVGTWGTGDCLEIPGNARIPCLPVIAVDPFNGNVYHTYFDRNGSDGRGGQNVDLFFQRSTDGGVTWTAPTVIPNASQGTDQFFPWMEVDRNGRIHVMYMEAGSNNTDGSRDAFCDNFYTYSDNGGASWATPIKLNTTQYNARNDGLNRSQDFIGDYLGHAVSGNRAYPCYMISKVGSTGGDTDIFTNRIVNPFHLPTDYSVTRGTESGTPGLNDLLRSDDAKVDGIQRAQASVGTPNLEINLEYQCGFDSISSIVGNFELRSSGSPTRNVLQRIQLLDNAGTWVTVDESAATSTDTVFRFSVSGAGRFLQTRDDTVRARVQWFDRGVTNVRWGASIDAAELRLEP